MNRIKVKYFSDSGAKLGPQLIKASITNLATEGPDSRSELTEKALSTHGVLSGQFY